jgi:diacylglycerol kinase (ATP)
MRPFKVILNPYSGRGSGARNKEKMCNALARARIDFDLAETRHVGHGVELAYQACRDGYGTVVAAGGDGTVSEVVNGLAKAALPDAPVGRLALCPIGTGNDFAAMMGSPRKFEKVAKVISNGHTRNVDLGYVTLRTPDRVVERYFNNNMGIGFEATVTLESYKIKRVLSGTIHYLTAVLRALRCYRPGVVNITWETADGRVEGRSQPVLLVSVGNSRRTGGGFYLTPEAIMDDGLFDVLIADAISIPRILGLLPKTLFGKHVGDPAVTIVRCRKLHVSCQETLPVQLDGEVVVEDALEIEIVAQRQRLEVVV